MTNPNLAGTNIDYVSRVFLIRSFEQRILKLFSEGKVRGTVHTCIGQEFVGVAVASHLESEDLIVSNHRCHGHYLARTGDVQGLMSEIMGRATGVCGGRGGSQHICAAGFFSNGVQGGMLPIAAGMALAQKLRQGRGITVAFIGDGTLGQGLVYETLNLASLWKLPLLVVVEHNGIAQSTRSELTISGDVAKRAEAFGVGSFRGDTWHYPELADSMASAIRQVRAGEGPVFFRVDTYRLMAHSKGDDDRPQTEVEHFRSMDPLIRFEKDHPLEARRLRDHAEQIVSHAVEAANLAPFSCNKCEEHIDCTRPAWKRTHIEGRERVVSRIHLALRQHMHLDDKSLLLGEDIEHPYGGAFKVTRDLSIAFPGRVRNTPISEAAIVGVSTGLALAGMHPVCEIMFGDFLTLAADQIINHAAKFQWVYNDQVKVPLVIRTPMGGRRGYGATHSQCLEKHFLGLPGTRVLALHHRYDPCAIYQKALTSPQQPTLVIENKILYGEYVTTRTIDGFWCEHTCEDFPTTRIRSGTKADITILCYGSCLIEAELAADRLFEQHEIIAEIICPTQIYPFRAGVVLDSLEASGRLLVIEEGQLFCGFGSEVLAAVCEAWKGWPFPRMRRLGAAPHPLPCCMSSELTSLPSIETIVAASREMCEIA
ncbi:MAG TPA: thiamine pyrophosphate-dependent enzyme [Bryobacteraceae bacterium]|jgi:2-oxoisovalerate dehydrogenase E1 component|nr:thiamine pyrophosphate-dependent enzyme [Bryobacteraceae bacterium]